MPAQTIPVADNCCDCDGLDGTAKLIASTKAWGHYSPFINYCQGSESDSRAGIVDGGRGAMASWEEFAANQGTDADSPKGYRTVTLHFTKQVIWSNEGVDEAGTLTGTLIRTIDRRDGQVIFESQQFTKDPDLDIYGEGWVNATRTLNDDGSYTYTGTQPEYGYLEPNYESYQDYPSNVDDQIGWECTITATRNTGSSTGYNAFGNLTPYVTWGPMTNTWDYQISDDYHAGPPDSPSALDDARQMLLLVDWADIEDFGWANVYYVRDESGIRVQIDYSEEGLSEIVAASMKFSGGMATASMSFFDNTGEDLEPLFCAGHETIQTPMAARTTTPPADSDAHGVGVGATVPTKTGLKAGQVIMDPFYPSGWLLEPTWGDVGLDLCSDWVSTDTHGPSEDRRPM